MASFGKSEACGQTVLPDRLVLIGQKLLENAKISGFLWQNSRFWLINQKLTNGFLDKI